MDRDLVPRFPEDPTNPMRFRLIGRVETDEELLSHRALPGRVLRLIVIHPLQQFIVGFFYR